MNGQAGRVDVEVGPRCHDMLQTRHLLLNLKRALRHGHE